MKLTRETLTKLILEAMNSRSLKLKLYVGEVELGIPEGFLIEKNSSDKMNQGFHQAVVVSRDYQKQMEITYDYEVQDIYIHIFVRDPVSKNLDYRGDTLLPAGSTPAQIREKFNELMGQLKKEK